MKFKILSTNRNIKYIKFVVQNARSVTLNSSPPTVNSTFGFWIVVRHNVWFLTLSQQTFLVRTELEQKLYPLFFIFECVRRIHLIFRFISPNPLDFFKLIFFNPLDL